MKSKTDSGECVTAARPVGSTRIGPEHEIAERDRRVLAEQDLAGIVDAAEMGERLVRQDFEMLRRIVVDEGDGRLEVAAPPRCRRAARTAPPGRTRRAASPILAQ